MIFVIDEKTQIHVLILIRVKFIFAQNILKLLIITRFLNILNSFSFKLRKIYEINYEKNNATRFDINILR